MSENGEEKLLAMARHIAKSLSNTTNMADEIPQLLSDFDERFTIEKLSEKKGVEPDTRACAALDHSLETLHCRLSHFVSTDDAAAFLAAVDDLNAVVAEWTPLAADEPVAACLMRAQDMLQRAMSRLEDEFRSLMERGAESFDFTQLDRNDESRENPPKEEEEEEEDQARNREEGNQQTPMINYDMVIDTLPSETINNLHEIAKRMVAGGYGKECSLVYDSCRRKFMKESLSRLGLRKLTIEDLLKLPWKDLEDEIERWIKASNVALKTLFPSERKLYDRVFLGVPSSSPAADLSFMEVCKGSVFQLLNFADGVAMGTRSPKLLFRVLDMFETMDDLIPKFKSMFCDVSLREEASMTWKRLGKAITWIFMELENLIRRDLAKTEIPCGDLHPITRDVMNYLRVACRSQQTLEHVFKEYGHPLKEYPEFDDKVPSSSSMLVQMNWIMELLESSLEAKSKIYKDHALSQFFLMNNVRYMVQEVKDSGLRTLLGNDWIKKHNVKVREYHREYQRKSLNKVLEFLKLNNESMPPSVVAKSMKEQLMLFNTYFENISKVQSSWFVFDEQLREEIRISLETVLVPAYRNFIGSFSEHIKHADRYIKHEAEEIQTKLKDLFQGSMESTGRRK